MRVWVPPPPTDRLWYAFQEQPTMTITARPDVGGHQLKYMGLANRVSTWVALRLQTAMTNTLVFPSCVDLKLRFLIPLDDTDEGNIAPRGSDAAGPVRPKPAGTPSQASSSQRQRLRSSGEASAEQGAAHGQGATIKHADSSPALVASTQQAAPPAAGSDTEPASPSYSRKPCPSETSLAAAAPSVSTPPPQAAWPRQEQGHLNADEGNEGTTCQMEVPGPSSAGDGDGEEGEEKKEEDGGGSRVLASQGLVESTDAARELGCNGLSDTVLLPKETGLSQQTAAKPCGAGHTWGRPLERDPVELRKGELAVGCRVP
eukprot:CAMPEP_0117683056 /NCGR_PEP_ID=MMETSP0804-20121206/20117_1 /TAXON_ID=1074897 /ORGANISM="Tetraselmis astigmatica, Strain CCMP880" /LENGTH=315 /DNA_ID=CAMNT_0005493465 /DNA_START=53 /DNA_END=998 /DNA_ORIENTATION=-